MSSAPVPVVSATGITAGTFADWLAYYTAQYQSIFGADVYLGNDSQDGQFIATLAQASADLSAACIAVYNSFSPATAQGAGLSSNVKINGLARLTATASTVGVTLTGVAGTVIQNGQVTDSNGNIWALPATVTIGGGGTVAVTATCTVVGATTAGINTVTGIRTPVFGWQSVTNAAAAVPGQPVETDAALRVRQADSVALPSVTIFDGIWAALEAVPNVTRVKGYNNDTNATDGNGIPAHNVAFVVEGGAANNIRAAIAAKIPPGIPTYGAISGTVTDTYGSTRTINFSTPTEDTITVALTIHNLTGWSTSIETAISAAITAFIAGLAIGQTVPYTQLFVPAYAPLAQFPGSYEITAMTIKKNAGVAGTSDLTMAWNEVAGATPVITYTIV